MLRDDYEQAKDDPYLSYLIEAVDRKTCHLYERNAKVRNELPMFALFWETNNVGILSLAEHPRAWIDVHTSL
jgi:hypothetical protein